MSASILEANLAAVQQTHPELARLIQTTSLDGFPAELTHAKSGAPTLRVLPPGRDKPVLLHSAYDPLREAQRWAESVVLERPTNVLVLGAGLGYHLLTLLKAHVTRIRFLVVIERDPRVLRLALSVLDLRSLFQRPGTQFLVDAVPASLPSRILEDARRDLVIHNCQILSHPASLRYDPDYYAAAQQALLDMLTYDEVNMRTNIENQGRGQFNIFMNLPSLARGYALKDCAGLLRGFPGIVAAAGPSLDKNVRQLREVNGRAALFVVDTAQNTMKTIGVAPDVVVTGDPTPLNFSHFEQIDSLGHAFLAFHPEVYRQITQKYSSHPYLLPLFDSNSPLLRFLFDLESEYGVMKRAMNVGHLALNLALHMGCAPILLAGFDFAFPRSGGATHAASAALSRQIEPMREDGTVVIGGKEGKAAAESGKMMLVPGYYGDEVPTTVPFSLYIKALEKTVAECGVEVVDATEGGARFEGTVRLPLRDAMRKYLVTPGVPERLDTFRGMRRAAQVTELTGRLSQGYERLLVSRGICDRLQAMLNQWKHLVRNQAVSGAEAQSRWREFEALWVEMCGDELFDAFLGNSVQHLYYRRQRAEYPRDNTGNAFLEVMIPKYESIVTELKTIVDHFARCVELARLSIQSMSHE
ncbi:MAG: motility associated factor glycosyltransferase family protein [bacterium]